MLTRHPTTCHVILLPTLLLFLLPPGMSQSTTPDPTFPLMFAPVASPQGSPPSPPFSSTPQLPTQTTQPSSLSIPIITPPVGAPALPLVTPAPGPAAGRALSGWPIIRDLKWVQLTCPLTFSPDLLSSTASSCSASCQPTRACCTAVNGYVFDAQCWDTIVNLERSVSASTRSQLVHSCSAADSAPAAAPSPPGGEGGSPQTTSYSICSQMVQIALSEAGRDISCAGTLFVYVATKAAKMHDRTAILNLATRVTTLQNFNLSSCSGPPSGSTPPSAVNATSGAASVSQSGGDKRGFNWRSLLLVGAVLFGLIIQV